MLRWICESSVILNSLIFLIILYPLDFSLVPLKYKKLHRFPFSLHEEVLFLDFIELIHNIKELELGFNHKQQKIYSSHIRFIKTFKTETVLRLQFMCNWEPEK